MEGAGKGGMLRGQVWHRGRNSHGRVCSSLSWNDNAPAMCPLLLGQQALREHLYVPSRPHQSLGRPGEAAPPRSHSYWLKESRDSYPLRPFFHCLNLAPFRSANQMCLTLSLETSRTVSQDLMAFLKARFSMLRCPHTLPLLEFLALRESCVRYLATGLLPFLQSRTSLPTLGKCL